MPLKLIAPLEKTVPLTSIDPTGDTWAKFKQATMAENEIRAAMFADRSVSWNDQEKGVTTQKYKFNPLELYRTNVSLTMLECNIHAAKCKCAACVGGESEAAPVYLFTHKNGRISQREFDLAWNLLPQKWAEALHEACLEVNPDWAPNQEAEEMIPSADTNDN